MIKHPLLRPLIWDIQAERFSINCSSLAAVIPCTRIRVCCRTLLYKYKGKVYVPPLEVVDDIITLSKCGSTGVALNQTVNTFIDLKELKLSEGKCSQIKVNAQTTKYMIT